MQVFKGIDLVGGMEQDSNIYVVDNELVVDTGTGFSFAEIKKEIESRHEAYKLKTIVNTHYHFDHTGGNKKFRDWLKASIQIHQNDKPFIESGQTLAEVFGAVQKTVTVDRALKDGSMLKTPNFRFEVIHTPGHTPGSICLYDETKKILISGDTLFENGVGRFDLPGGSRDQMIASLNKLLQYNVQYLFPGHGPPKVGGISFLVKQLIAHFGNKNYVNYEFY